MMATIQVSDFNEDEVVHIDIVGTRKVYSEAAYNKLVAERDRAMEQTEYVLASINRELIAERDLLREGHRLIKGFAEHIRDNAGNANLVATRAGNIIRWIEINVREAGDADD